MINARARIGDRDCPGLESRRHRPRHPPHALRRDRPRVEARTGYARHRSAGADVVRGAHAPRVSRLAPSPIGTNAREGIEIRSLRTRSCVPRGRGTLHARRMRSPIRSLLRSVLGLDSRRQRPRHPPHALRRDRPRVEARAGYTRHRSVGADVARSRVKAVMPVHRLRFSSLRCLICSKSSNSFFTLMDSRFKSAFSCRIFLRGSNT
jgi:hypothetical protein